MLTAMVWTFFLLYSWKYLTRAVSARRHVTTTSPSFA
jgi:hypothetical protein